MKALPEDPEARPIRLPGWLGALAAAHRRAILGRLHHCKVARAPATVHLIRSYLVGKPAVVWEALRWFYRAAQRAAVAAGGGAEVVDREKRVGGCLGRRQGVNALHRGGGEEAGAGLSQGGAPGDATERGTRPLAKADLGGNATGRHVSVLSRTQAVDRVGSRRFGGTFQSASAAPQASGHASGFLD